MSRRLKGFIPNLVAYIKLVELTQKSRFVYDVFSNIIARGHSIFIENKEYDVVINNYDSNINVFKINKEVEDFDIEQKANEFINAPLISEFEFNNLLNKQKKGTITKNESIQVEKYLFLKKFYVTDSILVKNLKSFYIENNDKNYLTKINNLLDYLQYCECPGYNNDEKTTSVIHAEKWEAISKLLKICGFTSIFDTSIIKYQTNKLVDNISTYDIKKIGSLFSRDIGLDQCRSRAKKVTMRIIILLLERILKGLFGITFEDGKVSVEKGKYFSNIKFVYNFVVIDYIIIKLKYNLHIKNALKNIILSGSFYREDIHGNKGKYGDYVEDIIKVNNENQF